MNKYALAVMKADILSRLPHDITYRNAKYMLSIDYLPSDDLHYYASYHTKTKILFDVKASSLLSMLQLTLSRYKVYANSLINQELPI